MDTILRVDTPKVLRDLDDSLGDPAVNGRAGLSLVFTLAASAVGVASVVTGNWLGVAVCAGWVGVWTGWLVRFRRRRAAIDAYRVPVRIGVDLVRSAHGIYRRLSPQSAEPALALIRTMYRLSAVDVTGGLAQERVRAEMKRRLDLLRKLQAAEEQLEVATVMQSLDDHDDLEAVHAWQEALAELSSPTAQRGDGADTGPDGRWRDQERGPGCRHSWAAPGPRPPRSGHDRGG